MRERIFELTTADEVNEFLEKFPTGAIFKAGGCHKTMEGFGHVEEACGTRKELHVGFIRVIENRAASNHVAELTGVVHQSPQFILFVDGKPVYDVDNWDIKSDVVAGALQNHLGGCEEECAGSVLSDVSEYVKLLETYLKGKMPEDEFEAAWRGTFRHDASLRGKEQFEILNSLYGKRDRRLLKERADELLVMLKKD